MKFLRHLFTDRRSILLFFLVSAVVFITLWLSQSSAPILITITAVSFFYIMREYGVYVESKRQRVFDIIVNNQYVPPIGSIITLNDGSPAVVRAVKGNVVTVQIAPV